jgi:hypothetical protein
MDLCRVVMDGPEVAGQEGVEFDVWGQCFAQESFQFLESIGELGGMEVGLGATGEEEDLADEVGTSLGIIGHDFEHASGIVVSGAALEELDAHEDWGEGVIEVVGHSAGEVADGLHALAAEELGFDEFLFRDVGIDHEDPVEVAGIGPEEGPSALESELFSGE